ncbi:Dihydroorotate dehydrogenase [Pyrenophora teres f. maculata]|nr:Dihydroorotate dehydrogenase [Pyrenophora teres f. maculata]
MAPLNIDPPVLNSSNPWCTTLEQLQELYNCPHTGAITTRTSLLHGFPHDPSHHQFAFFNPVTLSASPPDTDNTTAAIDATKTASLNTLGYSPLPLQHYLDYVQQISDALKTQPRGSNSLGNKKPTPKPIIISVTGSAEEIIQCHRLITALQPKVVMPLAMEINLSCPNIPGAPPPAYNAEALGTYLSALNEELAGVSSDADAIAVGIKTPPYTYSEQYDALITALKASLLPKREPGSEETAKQKCPISFITATNTLGSSLLLDPAGPTAQDAAFKHTLISAAGSGVGGLAGAPLHPLALGNVYTIKKLLLQNDALLSVQIIGTGGVEDNAGFSRMRAVGASAVGVGTAFGRKGLEVFKEIGKGGW